MAQSAINYNSEDFMNPLMHPISANESEANFVSCPTDYMDEIPHYHSKPNQFGIKIIRQPTEITLQFRQTLNFNHIIHSISKKLDEEAQKMHLLILKITSLQTEISSVTEKETIHKEYHERFASYNYYLQLWQQLEQNYKTTGSITITL